MFSFKKFEDLGEELAELFVNFLSPWSIDHFKKFLFQFFERNNHKNVKNILHFNIHFFNLMKKEKEELRRFGNNTIEYIFVKSLIVKSNGNIADYELKDLLEKWKKTNSQRDSEK